MINTSSTEFTASDGRRFAFPVGTAFLLLAALFWWRGHELPLQITAGLGGTLWAAGLVLPGKLGPVYRAWMRMALAISKVTTPIFMGIVYFIVFTPAGLIMRVVGKRPMVHAPQGSGFWKQPDPDKRGNLERQF